MRTTRSDLERVQRIAVEWGTRSRSEASLMSLQGGASVGTQWLLEEDLGRRSPLSEYLSLHSSLTHHRNINPFENKVWEIHIFIKKCVSSFIEVHKLFLIMFPLIFVLRLYNTSGLMVKVLHCNLKVYEFKLYYSHFQTNNHGKGKNSLIPPAQGKMIRCSFTRMALTLNNLRILICH